MAGTVPSPLSVFSNLNLIRSIGGGHQYFPQFIVKENETLVVIFFGKKNLREFTFGKR